MNFTPMKAYMDRLCAWRIPGNIISVHVGHEEVFRYSAGYADIEAKKPMLGNEFLNIYSCSKVATVVAALKLYEKGFFLLDDPLYDFIPEFRNMYIEDADGKRTKAQNPITLRQLFTMTSGLTYNTETESFEKARRLTDGKMDTLTVLRCFAEDPVSFEPGSRWQYSLSHDVLAGVVEVISGKKFRDYMKEEIFEPLGMEDTFYHNDHVRHKMAELYSYKNTAVTNLVELQSTSENREVGCIVKVSKDVKHTLGSEFDSGGAGITTTVPDYAKFCCALANWGVGKTGERILSPGTIELMRQNHLTAEQAKTFNWQQFKGYSYGLGVRTLQNVAISGTTGSEKEFGWGGAAGGTVLIDADLGVSVFYAHHMLNPQEGYYQPRLRNVLYTCLRG